MRRLARAVGIVVFGAAVGCGGSGGDGDGGPPPPPPVVELVSPNGGERWATGAEAVVRWNPAQGAFVDIDLSVDGGATWIALLANADNDGEQIVVVPSFSTTQARVRIGGPDGDPTIPTAPFDASAANFEIGPLFEDSGASLLPLDNGDVEWIDFDGDGVLDLAVCGFDGLLPQARLYSVAGGVFIGSAAGLGGRMQSSMAWGDYDGDGDLDLVINGFGAAFTIDTKLYRNDAGTMADDGSVLGSVNSEVKLGDYDGDGDLDLALAGAQPNGATTAVLRNDGIGGFVDADLGLDGYEFASLAWGDYDADGDLDLAIAGQNVPNHATRVYRNDGGVFVDVGVSMVGWTGADVAWGDADGDGDLDLAVASFVPNVGEQTRVYLRTIGDTFVDGGLVGSLGGNGEVAWGDADGDGDLDLAVLGSQNGSWRTLVFINTTTGFVSVEVGVNLTNGAIRWGDFDRDGDLDLAVMGSAPGGRATKVLKNLGAPPPPPGQVLNERPFAPPGLQAVPYASGVVLLWEAAVDFETPSSGLSYNVRIEAVPSFVEVAPGLAFDDGKRLVAAMGAVRPHDPISAAGYSLAPGVYFASVQAIDASYAGGEWSTVLFVVP